MRGYWKVKEEALDLILWRTRFGRGCGLVVRHCEMNELIQGGSNMTGTICV
jgi:hypothetical protein